MHSTENLIFFLNKSKRIEIQWHLQQNITFFNTVSLIMSEIPVALIDFGPAS